MRPKSIFSVALLLLAYLLLPERSGSAQPANGDDAITRRVERLAASHLWRNGMFPILDLPATASIDEVIARVFEMTSFAEGRATQYQILETRLVQIPDGLLHTYIAALVRTEFGDKIVLLKYEGARAGWWSRIYDSERSR